MIAPYLYIQNTKQKGRGVFTNTYIPAETVIEISPVIIMPNTDRQYLDKTLLHDYIFEWGHTNTHCCMALGIIPIYNHSYQSNCEYIMDYTQQTIIIQAIQNIQAGQELTINYNGESNNPKKIWFQATP